MTSDASPPAAAGRTAPEIRPEIASAALDVFMANGYDRATMREIARRAGLGISGLYAHVDSKQELIIELIRPVLEKGTEWVEAVADGDLPAEQKLRLACVRAAELYDVHPEVAIYLSNASGEIRAAVPDLVSRSKQAWIRVVRDCLRTDQEPGEEDVRIATYGILGMFSWMHRWYRPGGSRSGAEIGAAYAEMLLAGLQAFPAGRR